MFSKDLKRGFSLAETLIAIMVVGILAAILVPILETYKPNKNKAMVKKAYQEISRITYELVNDTNFYPDGDGVDGFDNVGTVKYNNVTYGDDSSQTSDAAKCKFANLFASKLNTISDTVNCSDNFTGTVYDFDYSTATITTTDGIAWYLPKTNFTGTGIDSNNASSPKLLAVDVNPDKECADNKCNDSLSFTNFNTQSCVNVKRFYFAIYPKGDILILGRCAEEYLKDSNLVKSDFKDPNLPSPAVGFLLLPDGEGHKLGSSNASGDDYFDGDQGNCNPSLFESDPANSGCLN